MSARYYVGLYGCTGLIAYRETDERAEAIRVRDEWRTEHPRLSTVISDLEDDGREMEEDA